MTFHRTGRDPDELPIDLSSIDADYSGMPAEDFVRGVMNRLEAGIVPAPADPLVGVWLLAKPIAIAAAVVLLAIASAGVGGSAKKQRPLTVADALGIPAELRVTSTSIGGTR